MSKNRWPMVPLGELLQRRKEATGIVDDQTYKRVTIRLKGRGIVVRDELPGSEIGTKKQFLIKSGQFLLSKIDAMNGAFGVVDPSCDGAIITGNFWTFDVNQERLVAKYFYYVTRTPSFVDFCVRSSSGTTNRRYLQEPKFLAEQISLPPLEEQQRLVKMIDALVAKIDEAGELVNQCDHVSDSLLSAVYYRMANNAPRKKLSDVSPLIRRPAEIDPTSEYAQVLVRSFGRGTFHNPPLHGSEITWQKPHLVKNGDVLVSNIKAWEGAIAVAEPDDNGRYGSHRYLMFVPVDGVATAPCLCFYLLSPEGLYNVGEASPGSADRNRTLSSKKMLDIEVPVPPFHEQQRFDRLLDQIAGSRRIRNESAKSRKALVPSLLDRAFRGEL